MLVDVDGVVGKKRAGGGGDKKMAAPPKVKQMLQARQAQHDDYKEHHEHNFMSLNEECQTQRRTIKDQERIIALLKQEKKRLQDELLEKGRDLQHWKDLYERQAAKKEEEVSIEELKRNILDRDETIEKMKDDIIQANSSQQNALEECEQLNDELRQVQRALKEQKEAHAGHDAMVAELRKELKLATTTVEDLEQAREAAMQQLAGYTELEMAREKLAKREEQCEKEVSSARTMAEKATERAESMFQELAQLRTEKFDANAEILRLEGLVAEVDVLRNHVQGFRESKDNAELVLRKQVADLEEQLEKERNEKRAQSRTVEAVRDEMALLQRENSRHLRQAEDKCAETNESLERSFKQKERELKAQLEEALREKAAVQEGNARLEQKLAAEHSEKQSLLAQNVELGDAVAHHVAKLEQHHSEREAALARSAELEAQMAQKDEEIADLIEKNKELQEVGDDAAEELAVLEKELEVLREVKDEDDATSQAAASLNAEWKTKYEALERQMESEAAEVAAQIETLTGGQAEHTAALEAQVAELTAQNTALASEKDQGTAALAAERSALQQQLAALQQELETLKSADSAAAIERSNKLRAEFENEKRQLIEKLRMGEAARKDLKTSLDAKDAQMRKLADSKAQQERQHLKDMGALNGTNKTLQVKLKEAEAATQDKLAEEQEKRHGVEARLRELQGRLAKVEQENKTMKETQLHW